MTMRLIPRLDIKGRNLVKGIKLEGLRVMGPAAEFAKEYAKAGADELLYVDAVASLYGRNGLLDFVSEMASSIFIPMTVGGGIRTVDEVSAFLDAGADKIAINTAALEQPDLIDQISRKFGSSTLVLSIQAKKNRDGSWTCYSNNGRDNSKRSVYDWAHEAVERGVGEVLVTSVDRDGTGKGFDQELLSSLTEALPVPVIGCGGAGKKEHIRDIAAHVDAVAFGSILHYNFAAKLAEKGADIIGDSSFKIVENKLTQDTIDRSDLCEIREYLFQDQQDM